MIMVLHRSIDHLSPDQQINYKKNLEPPEQRIPTLDSNIQLSTDRSSPSIKLIKL